MAGNGKEIADKDKLESYKKRFTLAINDDLNMPLAMGIVWELIREEKKSPEYAKLLEEFDEVLGLNLKNYKKKSIEIPKDVQNLIEERIEARKNKDWKKSDTLRDMIKIKGFIVKDTPNGVEVEKA